MCDRRPVFICDHLFDLPIRHDCVSDVAFDRVVARCYGYAREIRKWAVKRASEYDLSLPPDQSGQILWRNTKFFSICRLKICSLLLEGGTELVNGSAAIVSSLQREYNYKENACKNDGNKGSWHKARECQRGGKMKERAKYKRKEERKKERRKERKKKRKEGWEEERRKEKMNKRQKER